jgi:hypothetical protein
MSMEEKKVPVATPAKIANIGGKDTAALPKLNILAYK